MNPNWLKYTVKAIIVAFSYNAAALILCLRPLKKIRIGLFRVDRIGELAIRSEIYLRKIANDEIDSKELHLLIPTTYVPANHQLLKMVRRKIFIILPANYYLWEFIYRLTLIMYELLGHTSVWIKFEAAETGNFYHKYNGKKSQLYYNEEEKEAGLKLLQSLGLGADDQFVCLHARDSAYLDIEHSYQNRVEWSYHDYRDCEIDNYIAATEYLASLGIFTIRMGYHVKKMLTVNNPFIIDYATQYRSDFGDIYLSSKCKFFFGSEGGLICIPWILLYRWRIPIGYP